MTHNPANLSPEQVGVSEGWRLLDGDEIITGSCAVRGLELFANGKWEPADYGSDRFTTYRTRLTRAELRKARGLEPEAQMNITAEQLDRALLIQRIFRRKLDLGERAPSVSEAEIAAEQALMDANFERPAHEVLGTLQAFCQSMENQRNALQSENAELRARLSSILDDPEYAGGIHWHNRRYNELCLASAELLNIHAELQQKEATAQARIEELKAALGDTLDSLDYFNGSEFWDQIHGGTLTRARAALAKKGAE